MDFTSDDAFRLNLYTPFGKDDTVKFAGNDDVISLDLPFHTRPFAQDQAVAGNHVSFYVCVDAKHAGGFERPLKPYALIKEACKFMLLLVFITIFASPLHGLPPDGNNE